MGHNHDRSRCSKRLEPTSCDRPVDFQPCVDGGFRPVDPLLRAGYTIHYRPDAKAETLAPATLTSLFHQRKRWIFGNIQCIWKHRATLWTRSPWRLRWLGFPNYWFSHLMSFGLFALTISYLPRATHWLEIPPLAGLLLSIILADLCVCALAVWIDRADVTLLLKRRYSAWGYRRSCSPPLCRLFLILVRDIRWKTIRRPKFNPRPFVMVQSSAKDTGAVFTYNFAPFG